MAFRFAALFSLEVDYRRLTVVQKDVPFLTVCKLFESDRVYVFPLAGCRGMLPACE